MLSSRVVLSIHFLLALAFLPHCQPKSLGATDVSGKGNSSGVLWQPDGRTRESWMRCNGMPQDACERTRLKLQRLKETIITNLGLEDPAAKNRVHDQVAAYQDGTPDGCMWLTEEQVDMLMTIAKEDGGKVDKRRQKRAGLVNFRYNSYAKWSMPIRYKFDGTQKESHKTTIRGAFQHWMDNTCIRFTEVATDAVVTDNHIILTSQNSGCYSYVGKTSFIPQPLNLQDACLYRFGTPVHEIGHTLGFWHEQMRSDRDAAIQILWQNVVQYYVTQFNKADTDGYGLPYNYGSVMQYASKEGVSANGEDTMQAIEPFYQMNMGQRTGLSFLDIKAANLAYCQGTCSRPLSQSCQRGGYQNPNDCSRCICPDGFTGTYCDEVAPPKYAECGGVINLAADGRVVVKSPGYDDKRYYFSRQECNWWIKAPENQKLELTFEGDFGIYCETSACYHWVEIKYKRDLGLEGGRFCCNKKPTVTITSESNEMMIVFRSNVTVDHFPSQRGFQATVKTVSTGGISTTTTTTITTPTTTITRTTPTSTTTTTPATVKRTTPVQRQDNDKTDSSSSTQSLLWKCSFDSPNPPTAENFCGMIQDTTDQFDWTVYHNPTPSDPTGPDAPYDGNFYIYIEATDRQMNDEARLFFPRLNIAGDVCVDFFYHMYGFHINALKLVRITDSVSTVVWQKTGQMGNNWLRASVTVNLPSNSQLQFIGVRGEEYSGDIGLDKISVTSGRCSS